MDRNSGIADLPGSGLHMPPEVLGEVESVTKEEPPQRKTALVHANRRARKRSQRAVLATHSQAAAAAAAQGVAKHSAGEASIVTLVTFNGMEVFFATSHECVVGVCSRTHFLFQTLQLASESPVVSLTSNSLSGLLVVAHQDGTIQTYRPVPSDENTVFGKFLWKNSVGMDCKIFYQHDEVVQLSDRRSAAPGLLVDISSSYDDKLLVAHKKQLAVFDAALQMTSPRSRLLWTILLPTNVVTAKIAGDGQAIVVVLEGDQDEDGDYGARTFVHDLEDGSGLNSTGRATLERTTSVGIVFKPGPFLKHVTPVTRLSFRGLGRTTSSTVENQGNDLLLTYCESDSAVRIFNQNSWKQLMMWAAPPNSRADWIRGSSAFSLGDLESEKKAKGSRAPSRRPSVETDVSGGINSGLRNAGGSGSPNSMAGAWIAEITFRGAFPALRLSRLSYMKRGNDDSQPAHFESVAAILPAGSIAASSLLKSDDMGLAIQGIWPAWNPWLSEPTGNQAADTLTGSAMQFLGLSSVPPSQTPYFGESYLGGTHSPPTELRITASHLSTGKIVLMEFPLWGDDDFGAMELGSPLRSVLSLSSVLWGVPQSMEETLPTVSMDYDSSRLCAQIDPGQRSISLLWRKQGTQSLYSSHFLRDDSVFPKSIMDDAEPSTPQSMEDKSVIPVPIALPPLRLPSGTSSVNKESIISIQWWPDDSFDGPPLLLALTKSATLMVFEIPPPRSVQEPAMPNFDPFNVSSHGSVEDFYDGDSNSEEEEVNEIPRYEYEVSVTPHPDFGLGLRLESPTDGLPAIAGSFKKHPLNGGMLPAEKAGMIVLGDEVLSVNGVSVEHMTFDDIIATVRHVGAEGGPGKPLVLRFRPSTRTRKNSAVLHESFKPLENVPSVESDAAINRRSVMGVSPKIRKRGHRRKQSDGASLASMLVGSCGEGQQEFGRVIAVIRKVLLIVEDGDISKRLLVSPWGQGLGSPSPKQARGAALVLYVEGSKIYVKRLVLPLHHDPEKAELLDLGTLDLSITDKSLASIRSVQQVPFGGKDRCFALSDCYGQVLLVFLQVSDNDTKTGTLPPLKVSFRVYKIFNLEMDSYKFCIRPSSISLFATYQKETKVEFRKVVTLWTARSDPSCRQIKAQGAVKDENFGYDYIQQEIEVLSSDSSIVEIADLQFVKTGYLDYFPSLVIMLGSEAVVYQRRASNRRWAPIARISFPSIPSSVSTLGDLPCLIRRPQDAFPHLFSMIQAALPSFDENSYLVSDWHPESLLAHLSTDERGAKFALKGHVQKVLLWLSELIENASSFDNLLSVNSALPVAPFNQVGGLSLLEMNAGQDLDIVSPSISSMFLKDSSKMTSSDETIRSKLDNLMDHLERPENFRPRSMPFGRSQEFKLATSARTQEGHDENIKTLPPILASFPPAGLRVLWAITEVVKNTPYYGNMDTQGQLALTIFAIHKALKTSPSDVASKASSSSPYSNSTMQSFFQRRKSSSTIHETFKFPPQSASSGSVAALLSNYQGELVERTREPGRKLDWATVRELRMPYWIRSDAKLRQVSEEVGQSLYRESRDILKAAVFFLAAGKLRTLRNLAAADNTESGKKFFKFLTSFDFSTQRGRSAAEKNAYSLLRKNKYDCAAAFFLLAEPPLLKSAVETIASKMEDLDLAFMVSRLIGNAQTNVGGQRVLGFGTVGFSGVLGGGGGYAETGSAYMSEGQKDHETFVQWKPDLNSGAKDLLLHHALSNATDDSAFSALLHLWLDRDNEAWHWLSGFVECPDGIFPHFSADVNATRLHQVTAAAKKSQDPTISMVNSFINFTSGPVLLKTMNAAPRTRVASTILVSSSLCRIGVEIPALRSLAQNAGQHLFDQSDETDLEFTPKAKPSVNTNAAYSSIFDSYDQEPRPKSTLAKQVASSIFDDFDAPPQQSVIRCSDGMESSIFDSFVTPLSPPMRKPSTHVHQNGGMSSSIFDEFASPPNPKTPSVLLGNGVTSSIFESFDPPPPHKISNSSPSGDMNSSIFESFDPCPTSSGSLRVDSASTNMALSADARVVSAVSSPTKSIGGGSFDKGTEELEPLRRLPDLWQEWRQQIFVNCAARRVLRELATLGSRFHIDVLKPGIAPSGKRTNPFIPSNASQALQLHADGDEILNEVSDCLRNLSESCGVETTLIVEEAIRILESPYQYHRVCFAVLLHLAMNQSDLAEDAVRNTANSLIERCKSFSFSNDGVAVSKESMSHLSTLLQRQTAVHWSWQLEVCLWLHRGGVLPLSGLALSETICAVRIGMLLTSWNRDYEVLDAMIRQPPDCLIDNGAGRQLCSSLKIISNAATLEKKPSGAGSGGWEFLVDCRRAEATEMLRHRPTGCFIIRPHPEDHGVFTLSFKTNLKPAGESVVQQENGGTAVSKNTTSKAIKRDDVVQHAIVRLSDSGFRCGSFGPFATLMKLLEAVSSSLPFDLRFDLPPTEGVIKDEGSKPSPNCSFFRKLSLVEGKRVVLGPVTQRIAGAEENSISKAIHLIEDKSALDTEVEAREYAIRRKRFGHFFELLVLSEVRKQLSGVAAAKYDGTICTNDDSDLDNSVESPKDEPEEIGPEQEYTIAARMLRPFLTWCRMMEVGMLIELAPQFDDGFRLSTYLPVALNASETEIEISTAGASVGEDGGDAVIRRMIKPGSGVEFRTLRLGEGGESAMVVLFSKNEALEWIINHGVEISEADALKRLDTMEKKRVIEPVDLRLLAPKGYKKSKADHVDDDDRGIHEVYTKGVRYRLVDPWEVEPLESRAAETRGASLGRHRFLAFGLGRVSASCEEVFRSLGGINLLELWAASNGGVSLTKAIATVHPPWERASGGDLQLSNGSVTEPVAYDNSIRQHLYRNALFRRLCLPQRFMALIQVELLDLKNLTSPGGSLSLTVYALLRLKRPRSSAPLTTKARTLDSVATHPAKLGKATGPNAPASWGSLVRFRFPLPEHTGSDGRSHDDDREALFKGPPSVLQVSVYEKKFMSDTLLGGADVKLEGLSSGGQLEEWVPLRTETHGINWFARIRLTLRFELMCLADDSMEGMDELAPSVGLRRIQQLSSIGGMHEEFRKSVSTPDLLSYLESMVY